jgi:hypothetical protein
MEPCPDSLELLRMASGCVYDTVTFGLGMRGRKDLLISDEPAPSFSSSFFATLLARRFLLGAALDEVEGPPALTGAGFNPRLSNKSLFLLIFSCRSRSYSSSAMARDGVHQQITSTTYWNKCRDAARVDGCNRV